MVSFEFLAIIVSILGLSVSITYYAIVLRNANKTRQTQLYMQLFQELNKENRWEEYLYAQYSTEWTDYEDFQRKYGRGTEFYPKLNSLFWTYNAIGMLLYDSYVEPKRVYALLGPLAISFWRKWGSIIYSMREDIDQPEAYGGFEYLARKMISLKEDGISDELISELITPYLKHE